MSNDLISRSKLVKHIEDIFCEDCSKCHGTCRLIELKDIIQEQSTAYDKEKVVEQLEERAFCEVTPMNEYQIGWNECIDNAIEIVKAGEINE